MSSTPRSSRRNQKVESSVGEPATSRPLENNETGRRRSSRISTKVVPTVNKKPSSKSTIRRPEKVFKTTNSEFSDSDDDMPAPKKKSDKTKELLMSPTSVLAEQVGTLEISTTDDTKKRNATKPKTLKPTNLKNRLVQQRTPEKKMRSRTTSESTPEKKSRQESDSESDSKAEKPVSSSLTEGNGALSGREDEFNTLKSWILESKSKKTSLSMYVSGQPGTGKTATTLRVLTALGKAVRSCIINCASTNTKTALFKTIFESLDLDGKPSVESFEEHVKHFTVPLVLVLDEIDHLANRKNAALYAAFQWPETLSHKIIILGIANSIDLTERLLPKLMLTKTPKRLVFEPYTKDDIVKILNDKMKKEKVSLNYLPVIQILIHVIQFQAVIDAKSIELTARKVAAMSGDLRTALHIFKQQKSRLMPMDQESGPPGTPVNGCREVLGIINNVYSSPLARAKLPLQPRILLAVSLALSSSKKSVFDRNSLYRAYYKACTALRMPPLEDDDLHSAFQTLESQSFIRLLNGGKLVLQVDAPTAKSAISDNALLDQIGILQF
ncbi:CRE-CDC-6 protein [Caenorhabditis remanei]|uniref:Cell division control protein n=1 Tax=Caenorhabditis remanei TaxID=31234 RepID=E3MGJ8_CAERE|nr:CRE-CDC-6 protein [Caenorhabditis remanei]